MKNLNQLLSDTIMHKAKPDIEMRSKVVYSLRQDSKIYQDSRILLFMAIQKVSSLQGIKDYTD